eukprot:1154724-Pelagomonas_calceolata.AAC.3
MNNYLRKIGAGERERDKGEEEKRGKESIAKQSEDAKEQKSMREEQHEAAKKQRKAEGAGPGRPKKAVGPMDSFVRK